jgi:hypothetical protein
MRGRPRTTLLTAVAALLAVLAPIAGVGTAGAVGVGADDAAVGTGVGGVRTGDAGGATDADAGVCAGEISRPADAVTVISVQGMKFAGEDAGKRPARLVGVGPRGELLWVEKIGNASWAKARGYDPATWAYDVDPLVNGNVFVTEAGTETMIYELNTRTGERVWSETLPFHDTHDADVLGEHRVVVAQMRNYDEAAGENRDRVVIYNRTSDEVVWEWVFSEHYDRFDAVPGNGGNYTGDWTHLNDVDPVGEHGLLLSPRNFDQVLLVNRSTGEIELTLGENGNYDVLKKQHNPDYLESESGTPTVLVADSENNRVVEYAHRGGSGDGAEWERTWSLGGGDGSAFDWPRDADRLPNGNTLVTDSANHRVVEVTPDGRVVWEVYSPWLVYDATRVRLPESGGPTMTDLGPDATGGTTLRGGEALPASAGKLADCAERQRRFDNERWAANRTAGDDTADGDGSPERGGADLDAGAETAAERDWDRGRESTADVSATATDGPDGLPGGAVLLGLLALGAGALAFWRYR